MSNNSYLWKQFYVQLLNHRKTSFKIIVMVHRHCDFHSRVWRSVLFSLQCPSSAVCQLSVINRVPWWTDGFGCSWSHRQQPLTVADVGSLAWLGAQLAACGWTTLGGWCTRGSVGVHAQSPRVRTAGKRRFADLEKHGQAALQEWAPELDPGKQATEQGAASVDMMTEAMRPKRTLKKVWQTEIQESTSQTGFKSLQRADLLVFN